MSETDPIRQAFATRFHEVVEQLARTADVETISESLARADPVSGLSVALERAAVMDAGLRDPLAPARARGIDSRNRLLADAGGVLRLREAADRLEVTPQAVTARRQRGTILSVPMPNGEWVYPACQFATDGLLPGLSEVLREFEEVAPWTQLAVLVADSERFEGKSALALLRDGDVEAARSIAATYGEQG